MTYWTNLHQVVVHLVLLSWHQLNLLSIEIRQVLEKNQHRDDLDVSYQLNVDSVHNYLLFVH